MEKQVLEANGKLVLDLISEVVDTTGPRLPGSDEEKRGAEIVAAQMRRELGAEPKTEPFKMAPHASIAAIPALGMLGGLAFLLFYLSPIASLVLSIGLFIFALVQIFTYSGLLDCCFKKLPSQNVYAALEPRSGRADLTIMLSGHVDSSWNWNLSLKNPKTMIVKTILGVLGIAFLAVVSLVAVCMGAYSFQIFRIFANDGMGMTGRQIGIIVLYVLPLISLPGCYWLADFLSYDKKLAAPGAMDNMSGVAIGIAAAKYFKENPDLLPENCRIVCAGLGCEEAGLKGSSAFVKAHKDDKELMNDNLYVLNLDSFRDDDYFNVVKGDLWLGSRFDKDLMGLSLEAMSEAGLKGGVIFNPVGGCDSTPFSRAGIKTVTLNAQNPTATDYYHTKKDVVADLSMFSLEKGFEVVTRLIPKVCAYHEQRAKISENKA